MNKRIEYEVRTVYGKPVAYVVSEHKGAIECLTGKKTIDGADVIALMGLGFDVAQVALKMEGAK